MKTVLLSLSALLLASTTQAADISTKAPIRAASQAQIDRWTGPYGYFQIGVGQTKGRTETDTFSERIPVQKCYSHEEKERCYNVHHQFVTFTYPGGIAEDNVIGLLLGAGLGYNKRVSEGVVLGAEVDGVYSLMNGYINLPGGNIRHQVPYIFSLTGRAMYLATENTGLYLKGGLAVAQLRTTINNADTSQTKAGWTLGGGWEQQLPNLGLTSRLEGMYVKVTDQTVPFSGGVSNLDGNIWTAKAILSKPF